MRAEDQVDARAGPFGRLRPAVAPPKRAKTADENRHFRRRESQQKHPCGPLDASSLSTLVQMVSAGMGVTLIPEMAAAVETRSASVSVARFNNPQPSRTIGMIWRKKSPLAGQLLQLSEVVCGTADELRKTGRAGRRPVARP
jgi:DNA-binding transcriptional LysR family regulator